MPLYLFVCDARENHNGARARFEDIVALDTSARTCVCGATASRDRRPARFQPIGAIHSGMDRFESALLTNAQREEGVRFKSEKDIEKYERENGLVRQDPGGSTWRHCMEQLADEAADIGEVRRKDGVDGAIQFVKDMEIMDVTDWSRTDYVRWRNATDAAQADIESGRIDPAIFDAPAPV